MTHIYDAAFFDYINQSARASARSLIGLLAPQLRPDSVLDLGCGRGVWLDEWQRAGVRTILGVDGEYVQMDQLVVPPTAFMAADLTRPLQPARRFDLAQSLEVGEHLPQSASTTLVDGLTMSSDRVLFSAAVPGQGGEYHVNEQPLAFWQDLFTARGYRAFDCLRPYVAQDRTVAPWYRYNAILYVNAAGYSGLPDGILRHEIPAGQAVTDGGDLAWRLRRRIVSHLPQRTVTQIARGRATVLAALARRAQQARHPGSLQA